jgi:mono/diheme cytochrome c family protein
MRKLRVWLVSTLILAALATVTLLGMNLVGALLAGSYRNTSGLPLVMTAAHLTGGLAGLGLLSALLVIAVGAALMPGGWVRKALYMIPVFMLGLTILGVLMLAGGIGTTGTVALGPLGLPLSGLVTLIAGVGAILTVSIAAAVFHLDRRVLRTAMRVVAVTAVMAVLATLTVGVAAWMISSSQPSSGGEGAFGRPPGGFVPGGAQPPGAQTTPGAQTEPFGQGRPGFPEGGLGRGGLGRALGNVGQVLPVGVAVAAALSLAGLGVGLVGLRQARRGEPETSPTVDESARNVRGEIARAAAALCAVGAAVLLLIQFIPVSRTNPPVQTTVAWDSVQTKDPFYQACADCHSNETTWPWYAYVAPASWLTATDVNSARRQFNISEPSGRGSSGGFGNVNDIRQRIESGSMPPKDYLLMHPAARLTDGEKQQLIQGLENSLR